MAKKQVTVEEKLRALYDLQVIDSRIDKIHETRGELPKEVEYLENEISDIEARIEKLNNEVKDLDSDISDKKNLIKDAEALIKKYEGDQDNVRNNREFEALTKEMEYQTLEIQLAEKRINEYKVQIDHKKEIIEAAEEKLKERTEDLKVKQKELNDILKATEGEEKILKSISDKQSKKIEERLLKAYARIRGNVSNGLAVVPVVDRATVGSFFLVPPQREIDIAQRKKVIVSEHCGRILVDKELAQEEDERITKMIDKELKN